MYEDNLVFGFYANEVIWFWFEANMEIGWDPNNSVKVYIHSHNVQNLG